MDYNNYNRGYAEPAMTSANIIVFNSEHYWVQP